MKAQNNIIAKIQKLLAKAGSTDSPQEAEALFTMAQSLMVKHRIEQSALNVTDESEVLHNAVQCFKFRLEGNWEVKLASTIARPNCCDTIYNKHTGVITFYGVQQDIDLVLYLFETTRETFRRISKSEFRKGTKENTIQDGKNKFIRSFLLGACYGLSTKIQQMTAQHVEESGSKGYEIMITSALEKVKNYMSANANFKTVKSNTTPGSVEGFTAGVKTGKNHSLNAPITGTASKTVKQLS
jgi:hypothetical protein